jgi:hypothetical protein
VPTVNEEGFVWTAEDLFHTFITNLCFSDALICALPHWQGNPIYSGKDASTVFVAYIDDGDVISQRASKEGVYMFGRQVKFIHCGDSLTVIQCSQCHMLGHYATSAHCRAPINTIKCFRCGAAHDRRKHDYECTKSHKVLSKCDCVLKCLLCGGKDHHCRSMKCPKCGPGPSGISKLPEQRGSDETRTGNRSTGGEPRQKQQKGSRGGRQGSKHTGSHVPYTNHDAAMTVPAGICANDPEKSNILCECCPLPSISNFADRYMGAPEPDARMNTHSYPRACPISSKGKGIMGLHSEIMAQKKYGTATLREKSVDLGFVDGLHDEDEIEAILGEGEEATMRSKLTEDELNYSTITQG